MINPILYFSEEWVILGKHDCRWCLRLRDYMGASKLDYKYYDLAHHPELKDWLVGQNLKTVPQAYHLGLRIGGYEQTIEYIRSPRNVSTIGN